MTIERPHPSGHLPTLVAAFLHFDVSFMLWVLIGSLGIFIADTLRLDAAQQGMLVAVPILSGALLRIPVGMASDRFGAKRVGVVSLTFLFLPLLLAWRWGATFPVMLAVGLMLGTAGASFAIALPLASRWYPADRQGLVLGVAAAGNSGTVLANLVAPALALALGWHRVLLAAMLPLSAVLLAFVLLARDAPAGGAGRPLRQTSRHLRSADLWSYCFLYGVTFGGYVGLSGFLPLFLRDQYAAPPVLAGYITAAAAVVGSGMRPAGGWFADRLGGRRVLGFLLAGIALAYVGAGTLAALPTEAVVLILAMACLGMGNGAVFQLVPQSFRDDVGAATGIVGAVGGLGGFALPLLLGTMKQRTDSFAVGFGVLGTLAAVAAVGLAAPGVLPARGGSGRGAGAGVSPSEARDERAA